MILLKIHPIQSKTAHKVLQPGTGSSHLKVTVFAVSLPMIFPSDKCLAHPSIPSGLCLNVTLRVRSVLTTSNHLVTLYPCLCFTLLHKFVTISNHKFYLYVYSFIVSLYLLAYQLHVGWDSYLFSSLPSPVPKKTLTSFNKYLNEQMNE